jgi:hypothetical protein
VVIPTGTPTWRVGRSFIAQCSAVVHLILEVECYGLSVAASPGTTRFRRARQATREALLTAGFVGVQTWQVPTAWTIGTWLESARGKLAVPPPGRSRRA